MIPLHLVKRSPSEGLRKGENQMNRTTLQIAKYVASKYGPCDMSLALTIYESLDIDLSSCTNRELYREVDYVYLSLNLFTVQGVN